MSAEEYEMTDEEYEDLLDEIYGDVTMCGMTFSSGRALKELDEIAFYCGKSEETKWKCSECGKIYDDEDDAEECWKECADTVDCDWCGEPILFYSDECEDYRKTIYNNHGDIEGYEHYCSRKCWDKSEQNLNSHLGDKK